jgi:hypothetical protein
MEMPLFCEVLSEGIFPSIVQALVIVSSQLHRQLYVRWLLQC